MLNNRQGNNNRRRGRNNNQRPQGNGQNRNGDNSNRIDNRARGNAPQLLEKYRALARDAQMAGDRVLTEYYHQFADHYFRVVAETRARFEDNRRPRDDWESGEGGDPQADARGDYDDGDDDDFNDRTFDDNRRSQQQRPQPVRDDRNARYEPQNGNRATATGQNDDDSGDETQAQPSSWEARAERMPRENREPRQERQSSEDRAPRQERQPREDRPARRPRFEQERERTGPEAGVAATSDDVPMMLDLAVLPPAIAPVAAPEYDTASGNDAPPAPKKRGRPRKIVAEADAG